MSFWDRIGDIFDSAKEGLSRDIPAPVGAIVNLASTLSNPLNAAATGVSTGARMAGDAFFKSQPGQAVTRSVGQGLTWAERNVWSPVTDYVEASSRLNNDINEEPINPSSMARGIGAKLGLGVLNPEFREDYWPAARANDSSIMQSVWEQERAVLGNEKAGFKDPATGKWTLPLIDDPEKRADREAYFDKGAQKWVTGIGDATLSVVLDPLNVATGGIGAGANAARNLTGKSIQGAAAAGRGAKLGDDAAEFIRGSANTADVTPGTIKLDGGLQEVADDAPRSFLRKEIGDDSVQSLYDETVTALGGEGDKTSAVSALLEARGIDPKGVLDNARFAKGDGRLTPEGVLTAAGEDLMSKKGVDALFDGDNAQPFFRRTVDNQDAVANNLGLNAKKYRSNVEKLTDYAWEAKGRPGSVAQIADDYVLGQSSDTGAIADAMGWIAATVADEKTAKGLMDDMQYAAAGDGGALRRIESFNTRMALDVEAMATLDRTAALDALNSSPLKTPAEKLAIANNDDLFMRMRAEIEPELTKFVQGFDRFSSATARVQAAGTLGGVAKGGLKNAGDITRIPIYGTWQPFRSLPPVRALGGTHLPGKLSLDDPEAGVIYNNWLDKTTARLGLMSSDRDLALTGQFKDDFVASADAAVDPGLSRGTRANTIYRANQAFKRRLTDVYSKKYGVDKSEIELWIDTALDVRDTELGAIVQGARSAVEGGSAVMTRLPGGQVVTTSDELSKAIGTPQFQDAADLTDWSQMDKWLDTKFKPGYADRVAAGSDEVTGPGRTSQALGVTEELLEEANDAWKVFALTRVAYPLRVQMDTQARNLATFGAVDYMKFLFTGVGNYNRNTKYIDRSLVELIEKKRSAFDEMSWLEQRGENDERIAGLQEILDMDLDAWKASGKSTVESGFVPRGKTSLKTVQGSAEKIDPKTGAYDRDRFAPYPRGDESMQATLGEGVQASVEGLYKSANSYFEKRLRKELGYNYVDYGTKPETRNAWTSGYIESVNHGLRNDASWGRMLSGADDDTIIEWMRRSPDGKAYFREMNNSGNFENPEDLVARQRMHFDNLIPDREAADIAAARDINADDVGAWWAGDDKTRPIVPTKIAEELKHAPGGKGYQLFDMSRKKWFKFAAQMPETYMGRHPQYVRFYRSHMDRFLKSSDVNKDSLTMAEVNELRKRADSQARRDMAKIMFDTSHKSEMGHHLRFISPFFSAWEDTIFKWSKIVADNPAAAYNTIVRPFESLTSTNNVYDSDGNRIMPNGEKRAVLEDGTLGEVVGHSASINDGYMVFTLPDWMVPGEGEQDFRMSRGSLNAIFQGEDWWNPGVGPMVQVPMNETIKNAFPEVADNPVIETLMPYGQTAESIPEQVAPAHIKHLVNLIRGEGSEGWSQTYNTAMQDELISQRKSGNLLSEKDTRARVENATRNLMLMKWIGSGVMPASTQPNSRLDWYRKEFRRYTNEHGPVEGLQQFQMDYPEFTEVTISLSDNTTGISAYEGAQAAADPWKSEIEVNPEVGWAFAGADNYKGEWSDGIYTHQKALGWRKREDPNEAFDRINISRGWQDWQTLTNIIDSELDKRGLTSLMSKGAEDLMALKNQTKAQIMQENPSWAEEYTAGGAGADKAVDFLNKMNGAMSRNPKKAGGRQDLQTLGSYISQRESLREVMGQNGVSSLPTEEELTEYLAGERGGEAVRYSLAQAWYEYVASLKNDSPVFGDMYSRAGLERDSLSNPVVVG